MRLWNKLMAAALLMAPMAAQAVPADVAAAVAVDARPADAVKLDESRRPVQVLGFLGLKKGDSALDRFTGGGFYAASMGDRKWVGLGKRRSVRFIQGGRRFI